MPEQLVLLRCYGIRIIFNYYFIDTFTLNIRNKIRGLTWSVILKKVSKKLKEEVVVLKGVVYVR